MSREPEVQHLEHAAPASSDAEAAELEPTPAPVEAAGTWRSTLVLALAVLALVHSLVLALWLAPPGPVRDAAGPSRLAFYVNPYFQQSWSAMDPSAQRIDEALQVRARIRTGPETFRETPWIDVTERDLSATRGRLAPPRSRLAARRLASSMNLAMLQLGNAGRARAEIPIIESSMGELGAIMREEGVDRTAVSYYLRLDRMATRYASLYTQAVEPGTVEQVQYRSGRRAVPSREERDERRLEDESFEWFLGGWRAADRGSADALAAFDDSVTGG